MTSSAGTGSRVARWARTLDAEVRRRRSASAYWLTTQRLVDYTLRAGLTRAGCVVVAAVALSVADGPWWSWTLVAIPAVAVYLVCAGAAYRRRGRLPREWVAAWTTRRAEAGQGLFSVNPTGVLEAVGALTLLVLGAWGLPVTETGPRLVVIAAAVTFAASWCSAVFIDVAWYHPTGRAPLAFEVVRTQCGLGVGIVCVAVTAPARWSTTGRVADILICAFAFAVQIRMRETDRALRLGTEYAQQQVLAGRQDVTVAMHSVVGNPLIELKHHASVGRQRDRVLFDAVRQVEAGYRETLALEWDADVSIDWPGVLISRLEAITGQFGVPISFEPPDDMPADPDRFLARLVLDDLATNAAKCGSTRIAISMVATDHGYLVTVSDDGPPFPVGAWLRPHGGLVRLESLLAARGGALHLEPAATAIGEPGDRHDPTKHVVARWRRVPNAMTIGGGA